MAMINYADKVALNSNSGIADINKCNATDMNEIKSALNNYVQTGWYTGRTGTTYAFVSWNSTTKIGIVSTSQDVTSLLSVGMKVRFVQNATTKYGIIVAITSTQITLFMGTDYTLTNAGITDAYYSIVKAPYRFPMDPSIWTLTFTPDTSTIINNPVPGTWYNLNTFAIPIGKWEVSYVIGIYPIRPTSGDFGQNVTISTTTNSETNALLSSFIYFSGGISAIIQSTMTNQIITTTVQTNYYLNIKTDYTGLSLIRLWEKPIPRVNFTCAYL